MMLLMLAALLQTTNPPIREIDRGVMSFVDTPRQLVMRSTFEWTNLWKEHKPDRQVPPIDFENNMVVAIFLGSRPTAGFSVEIARTHEDHGALVVEYIEKRPGRDTIAAQVLTSPYHIVAMPIHTGEIRFEKVEK